MNLFEALSKAAKDYKKTRRKHQKLVAKMVVGRLKGMKDFDKIGSKLTTLRSQVPETPERKAARKENNKGRYQFPKGVERFAKKLRKK